MSERLRLLILTEGYPWRAPDGRHNLAGAFHRDQYRLIAEAGIEVTVVAPTPWVPPGLERRNERWAWFKALPHRQEENGIAILRPRYLAMPRENLQGAPDVFRWLAARGLRLPRPDVIQAYFAYPTGAAARRLARGWGGPAVPYVVGMLGDDVNVYPQGSARNRRLLRTVIADAGFAFANGVTLAENARRLTGIDVPSISIGASARRFAGLPPREEIRRRLGWPLEATIALYVGWVVPTKGMAELAAALDAPQDPRLLAVVIGDGPLRAMLAERANVRCEGPQAPEHVTLAMAAADVLVHPSHYEGLPTVLVEAGFAGLPVITTDAPGCIDLAGGGRAVMVPARNAGALADALRLATEQPQGLRAMAGRMLAHVRADYDLERNTARLVDVYRRLAGRT